MTAGGDASVRAVDPVAAWRSRCRLRVAYDGSGFHGFAAQGGISAPWPGH